MEQLVLEGTWEEIAGQSEKLSGKRVKVTVLLDAVQTGRSVGDLGTPEERIRALDALAEEYRHLPALPPEAFDRESLYEGHF